MVLYIRSNGRCFWPKPVAVDQLGPGEIGFINAGVKTVSDAKVMIQSHERRPVQNRSMGSNHLFLLYFVVCFLLMQPIFRVTYLKN